MRDIILLFVVGVLSVPAVALGQAGALPQELTTAPLPFVPWKTEEALLVAGGMADYPQIAGVVHAEGCVYVRAIVGKDGATRNVSFLTGSALLMNAAYDAVTNWRFAVSDHEILTVIPMCAFLPGDNPATLLSNFQRAAAKHYDAKNLTAFAYELLLVGSPDEAEKQFRQALTLKPDETDARIGLADSLAAEGDLDGAIDAYQQGLAAAPKLEPPRVHLANSLWYKGDLAGAIAQYRIVLKNDSINFAGRARLAGLLLETGDADGAIEEYKRALHDDPLPDPAAHYGLGQAYEKKGDIADALKEYKNAMKQMPQNAEFQEAYKRISSH